jgi:diacylglycerol O-acyltransferase / wax synthase
VAAFGVPRRLSALDNAFLALESDTSPMHISCLAVYQCDEDSFEPPLELVCRTLAPVLEQMPELRRTLLPGAPMLGRSYWGRPGRVELRRHVLVTEVPAPGGLDQLFALAARLHSRRLDRSRPLWQVWVIRGLAGLDRDSSGSGGAVGHFAVLFKVHHAAVDGLTGMSLFAGLHRRSPAPPGTVPLSPQYAVASASSGLRALLDDAQSLAAPMRSTLRIARTFGSRDRQRADPAMLLPWTALNGSVSRERSVAAVPMAAAAVAQIRRSVPASTTNDVVLAVIGGALRSYLDRSGALPERDLVAAVPIVRRRPTGVATGNDFDLMRVPLGVTEANVLRRLAKIQRVSAQAKEQVRPPQAAELSDGAEVLPGWILSLAVHASPALSRLGAPMPAVTTIVSNVAGPRFPLYLGGAELSAVHALGPVTNGLGVFHAVTAYRSQIMLTVTSSPSIIANLADYTAHIGEEFTRLLALT